VFINNKAKQQKTKRFTPIPCKPGPPQEQQEDRLERLTDLPAGTIGLPPSRSCRRNAFQPAITRL
jgi:hypothetical protein